MTLKSLKKIVLFQLYFTWHSFWQSAVDITYNIIKFLDYPIDIRIADLMIQNNSNEFPITCAHFQLNTLPLVRDVHTGGKLFGRDFAAALYERIGTEFRIRQMNKQNVRLHGRQIDGDIGTFSIVNG